MGEGEGEKLSPFRPSIFPLSPETPDTQASSILSSVAHDHRSITVQCISMVLSTYRYNYTLSQKYCMLRE